MITEKIPFYSYTMVYNEQTMYGAMTYSSADFAEAAALVNGGLDLNDFITQTMELSQAQRALDVLARKKEDVVKVMLEI